MSARTSEALARATVTLSRAANAFYWRIALFAGAAFASTAVTLSAISFALPGLSREWSLGPRDVGVLTAVAGLGQLMGSVVAGALADRFGRRWLYAVTVAACCLGTGLGALAPNLAWLCLLLFVGGLGYGGVTPVAGSLVAEFTPADRRGAFMGWAQVLWAAGWAVEAFASGWLAESLSWRAALGIAALPVVLGALGPLVIPESPRFLLAQGRRREAEALVERLGRRHGVWLALPQQQLARPRIVLLGALWELWGPRYRRRTAVVWGARFIMVGTFNGPIVWLPELLATASGVSAYVTVLTALAMFPASFVSIALIERLGRRPLLAGSLMVAALATAGLGASQGGLALTACAVLMVGAIVCAWPAGLALASELYPTRIRASAAGWSSAGGGSAGVVAPALLGMLIGPNWAAGRGLALFVFAVALALAGAAVAASGVESAGRTLEELSPTDDR